ncbi:MAG TPA: cytochrome P450 [Gammaproteobacteria bacterium]|nr:cytochrome P450 [Gammaproteobacteria bacterium]
MAQIPRETGLDKTAALLSEGYRFIPERCRRHHSDIFETRLMLRKAVCISGPEAAEVFYHPDRFTRKGAMPPTALKLLQDKGSVQQLSGDAHRHRKHMFMSLMTEANRERLLELFEQEWRASLAKWQSMEEVVLHYAVQGILCRAICRWSGIPLTESEAQRRTREFGAMIDGAGSVGPRNWQGMALRARTERWARELIEEERRAAQPAPEDTALHRIARYRNRDGTLFDVNTAAVELVNILRPTVAVARFITFAALALHDYPEWRGKLGGGDERERFVQEVRRFYPFFPLIGGRVQQTFEWRGYHFDEGTWVVLDIYGTDHDARAWNDPEVFRPDRFRGGNQSPYNLIPQGAGDYYKDHRCPGEWITIDLMKAAVRLLTTAMRYDVPKQDLSVDLSRLPAIPASRFIIKNVQPL